MWECRLFTAALRAGDIPLAKANLDSARKKISGIIAGNKDAAKAKDWRHAENEKPFIGEHYERCMVHFYSGLFYWMNGELDNAVACFKTVNFTDMDAGAGVKHGNWAAAKWLEALALEKMGEDSEVAWRASQDMADLKLPKPSRKDNVLLVVESGRGPQKKHEGKHNEIMRIVPGELAAVVVADHVLVDGRIKASMVVVEDIAEQAIYRNQSGMAYSNEGKAWLKENFSTMSQANPEADIRQWGSLPGKVAIYTCQVGPGTHEITVEGSSFQIAIPAGARDQMFLLQSSEGGVKMLLPSLALGRKPVASPATDEKAPADGLIGKEELARQVAEIRRGCSVGSRKTEMDAMASFVKQWEKRADQGSSEAQYLMGECHELGVGMAQDHAAAERWFRKSAEQGYVPGQLALVDLLFWFGEGDVQKNKEEAESWLRKAVDQGDIEAKIMSLSFGMNMTQLMQRDMTKHAKASHKWAEQGNAQGQFIYACCLMSGQGVAVNRAEALALFRKSAEQGLEDAQLMLSMNLRLGMGVPKDPVEADKWERKAVAQLRQAAELGDANLQFKLGVALCTSQDAAKDKASGLKWLRKSTGRIAERIEGGGGKAMDEFIKMMEQMP